MPLLTFASQLASSGAYRRPVSPFASSGRVGGQAVSTRGLEPFAQAGPTQFSVDRGEAISKRELGQFALANKDLLYVIDQSEKAQEFLKKKSVQSRGDLAAVVADTAHSLLNASAARHVDRDFLERNVQVASLIVLNTGKLRDALNESEDNAKLLAQGAQGIVNDTFRALAKKAAALFSDDAGNPLNDEEFFANNPKAAIYLLKQPDAVQAFTKFPDGAAQAKAFKERVGGAQGDALDAFAAGLAAQATASGAFNAEFFEGDSEFAEFVAARELLPELPSASQFLRDHPEMGLGGALDRFNAADFMGELTASQARAKLSGDSPLDQAFLSRNAGLSRLLLQQSDRAQEFNSAEAKKQLSYVLGDSIPEPPSTDVLDRLKESFRFQYQDIAPTLSFSV